MTADPLRALVDEARSGNRASLEELVRRIQPHVQRVALRMLWHPEDAADATQDILIRVVTHLGGFRGESRFLTWVYGVATNYLLTCRRSRLEERSLTFEQFAADLRSGLSEAAPAWTADQAVLLEEVKVGCMLAMLTCLDREHRLAYILGEILELDGTEAAAILHISPAAFRKRLSRARHALVAFTREQCGLIDASNPCHCARRLPAAKRLGRVQPDALVFASAAAAADFPSLLEKVKELDAARRLGAIYRAQPDREQADALVAKLSAILDAR